MAETTSNTPEPSEREEAPEREATIKTGGESLSIFEVMQRYRNDGSCERVIQEALQMFANDQNTIRCAYCGSDDIADISGEYETGVVAPDGYRERCYENGFRCVGCGRDQEYH